MANQSWALIRITTNFLFRRLKALTLYNFKDQTETSLVTRGWLAPCSACAATPGSPVAGPTCPVTRSTSSRPCWRWSSCERSEYPPHAHYTLSVCAHWQREESAVLGCACCVCCPTRQSGHYRWGLTEEDALLRLFLKLCVPDQAGTVRLVRSEDHQGYCCSWQQAAQGTAAISPCWW